MIVNAGMKFFQQDCFSDKYYVSDKTPGQLYCRGQTFFKFTFVVEKNSHPSCQLSFKVERRHFFIVPSLLGRMAHRNHKKEQLVQPAFSVFFLPQELEVFVTGGTSTALSKATDQSRIYKEALWLGLRLASLYALCKLVS